MQITTLLLAVLLSFQVLATDSMQTKIVTLKGVHRVALGTYGKSSLEIWIVDGLKIRHDIYPQFVYGGNSQRYSFIPKNEIWIDNAISSEEFSYTVAHELFERDLMAKSGLDYGDAHDSALQIEHRMRMRDFLANAIDSVFGSSTAKQFASAFIPILDSAVVIRSTILFLRVRFGSRMR